MTCLWLPYSVPLSWLRSAFSRSHSQAAVSLTCGVLKLLRKMRSTVKVHFWLSINHSLICEPQVLQGVLRIHVIARFYIWISSLADGCVKYHVSLATPYWLNI